MTRRVTCISLPYFPMERWRHRRARTDTLPPDEAPVALWIEGGHGRLVHAVNIAAAQAGVRGGARLADMCACCPGLHVEPADPGGDAAALDRLALWVRRFSPFSAADRSGAGAGLVLDTTGVDHLWGGESAMLAAIEADLGVRGLSAQVAVAPTWGAAWGLARFGAPRAVARDSAPLLALPVTALRLSGETVRMLRRVGMHRVRDLAAIPRVSLARRFRRLPTSDNPLVRLDQALGHLDEPISPPEMPPAFRAVVRLPEPVVDPAPHLPDLSMALCRDLAAAHQGARRLRLSVWRVDGALRAIEAGASAVTRDPAHIAFLFRDRLERIDPGFGFDLIELAASETAPLVASQRDLTCKAEPGISLPQLLDRLAVRFGPGRITRPEPRASYVPERAIAEVPATSAATACAEAPAGLLPRPLRLFEPPSEIRVTYAVPEGPPAQFLWRGRAHRVTRWAGAERIAPEWWRDRPGARLRDYYRVEDDAGLRLWVFREGIEGDGRGGAPRWFVHGMFG